MFNTRLLTQWERILIMIFWPVAFGVKALTSDSRRSAVLAVYAIGAILGVCAMVLQSAVTTTCLLPLGVTAYLLGIFFVYPLTVRGRDQSELIYLFLDLTAGGYFGCLVYSIFVWLG